MMGRVDPAELVRQTRMAQGLYDEGRETEATLNALQKSGSLRAADETEELRKAFAESERKRDEDRLEQAKENRENRKLTIISIVVGIVAAIFGGASFVVSLIALLR